MVVLVNIIYYLLFCISVEMKEIIMEILLMRVLLKVFFVLVNQEKIDSYHLTGIKFTPSQSRLYPNGVFASHLIGLTESEDKKLVGIMGLEKVFNRQLSGRDGINNTATDSYGVQLPGSSKKKRSVQNGDDIYTTLDPKIQTALENLLTQKGK